MAQHYPSLSVTPEMLPEVEGSLPLIRQLIKDEHAPHFIMRRFDLPPLATHRFDFQRGEQEIFILSGQFDVSADQTSHISLSSSDFLYVPPEITNFTITNSSQLSASFLEIAPKLDQISCNLPRSSTFLHGHYTDVEAALVTKFGSTLTNIRVLINDDQAHQILMRRFEIAPGGTIGIHHHVWEHEMYVLEGKMFLLNFTEQKEEVHAGEFIYMPSNEDHGYSNESTQRVVFICMIPNLKFL